MRRTLVGLLLITVAAFADQAVPEAKADFWEDVEDVVKKGTEILEDWLGELVSIDKEFKNLHKDGIAVISGNRLYYFRAIGGTSGYPCSVSTETLKLDCSACGGSRTSPIVKKVRRTMDLKDPRTGSTMEAVLIPNPSSGLCNVSGDIEFVDVRNKRVVLKNNKEAHFSKLPFSLPTITVEAADSGLSEKVNFGSIDYICCSKDAVLAVLFSLEKAPINDPQCFSGIVLKGK